MKTQLIHGSSATVFIPGFRVKLGKAGRLNGANANHRLVVKFRLAPVGTKCLSGHKPAHRDHSILPASLQDWLASHAALEICRRDRNEPVNPNQLWNIMAADPATA